MATSNPSPNAPAHTLVPLHLTGNTTAFQHEALLRLIAEAGQAASETALAKLDQHSAQTVLESHKKLTPELCAAITETILRHTFSDKFKDEAVGSDRVYPVAYKLRPIEAQVSELRRCFPELGACTERLARLPVPVEAEAWFAVPRWQALAPTYAEATERAITALASKRRFSNRLLQKLNEQHLRPTERSKLAQQILCDQQQGSDILVAAAQFGLLHRGSSARRTRAELAGHEYCLGTFAIACMLLTHPERLSSSNTLMIDCGGDEYSAHGDHTFDRVPLFDFDLGGIDLSIFYEDRARNLWGTPTAFLFKLV